MCREIIHLTKKGVEINISAMPGSSRCKIVGIHDNSLKIKLTKPPVDGQANAECCKVVAKVLGVPKSMVNVVRGLASRRKVLLVKGVSEDQVRVRLLRK